MRAGVDRGRPHFDLERPTVLAVRLTQARLARGYRQRDVAALADVAPSQLAHWETGRVPSVPNLVALADALDVSVDWLLGRDTFAAGCCDTASATAPGVVAHGGQTTAPAAPLKSRSGAVVVLSPDAA